MNSPQQNFSSSVAPLIDAGAWLAQRHWVPATGGNLSVRVGTNQCLITASGKDKGQLTADDCLHIQWQNNQLSCDGKPSAETLLHTRIFDLDPTAGAVLHTHSVSATVLSRLCPQSQLEFSGYEMQKSISGQTSHQQTLQLPILANNQDMVALADTLTTQWQQQAFNFAFLVRGHGLYAWGNDMAKARQHIEGWEFLIACELERLRIGQNYAS